MSSERIFTVTSPAIDSNQLIDPVVEEKLDKGFRDLEKLAARAAAAAKGSKDREIHKAREELEEARRRNEELKRKATRVEAEKEAYESLNDNAMAVDPTTGETVVRPVSIEDIRRFDPGLADQLERQGVKAGEAPPRRDEVLDPRDFGMSREQVEELLRK